MVAQAAGRAHHDMDAVFQHAALAARVHAADAGDDARAGVLIEPAQFALHLERQFAGRGNDEALRRAGRAEEFRFPEQRLGHGEAEGHRLAGTGLGGNQ